MQAYLVQLRGEDEDDGDDRLALVGRRYFLSSVPSSTLFFFFLSVLDPSALSLLHVFSLLVRALCFSLLVPNLLRLSLRFVLLCVFPVVFGLYFSPFIPSFCFLNPVPSFFTRSCLTNASVSLSRNRGKKFAPLYIISLLWFPPSLPVLLLWFL